MKRILASLALLALPLSAHASTHVWKCTQAGQPSTPRNFYLEVHFGWITGNLKDVKFAWTRDGLNERSAESFDASSSKPTNGVYDFSTWHSAILFGSDEYLKVDQGIVEDTASEGNAVYTHRSDNLIGSAPTNYKVEGHCVRD